jgi:predicted CoA-binding protein
MKHMNLEEALVERLLRRTRTIAVIGASSRPTRHSGEVVRYLHDVGYDVIPVRPDRARVAGLPSYAQLDAVGGPVDLVVIFRHPEGVTAHVREAAAKRADAVWLPPGAWSREAEDTARRHGLAVVKDRCIVEDHRHLFGSTRDLRAGHPHKAGVHVSRRKAQFEDNRKRPADDGYVAGGGGGRVAGGGVRAVLDERKMMKGRPSPRSGPFKPKPT